MRCSRCSRAERAAGHGEAGSTLPLILGFYLVALLMVAAAVVASGVFGNQRDLQAVCDAAAVAGANSVDATQVHGGSVTAGAVPLSGSAVAVERFLSADPSRSGVTAEVALQPDGATVRLTCHRTRRVGLAGVFGRSRGIAQTAHASARSPFG